MIKLPAAIPTPWKNGLGSTKEIAIYPPLAKFPEDDFIWRISNAEVRTPNLFSQFPAYDRWLMVWKGPGLILNGSTLKPFTPFLFPGELPVQCDLVADETASEVQDLGIIYQRGITAPSVQIISLIKGTQTLSLKQGAHFLFCAQGAVEVEGIKLVEGETVSLHGPHSQILCASVLPAQLLAITLA